MLVGLSALLAAGCATAARPEVAVDPATAREFRYRFSPGQTLTYLITTTGTFDGQAKAGDLSSISRPGPLFDPGTRSRSSVGGETA